MPNGILAVILSLLIFALLVALSGLSLWRSARDGQKNWFVILLLLNTFFLYNVLIIVVAAVEVVYLLKYAKDKSTFKKLNQSARSLLKR